MIIYWASYHKGRWYPLYSDTNFFLVINWVVAFNEEGPRWVKKTGSATEQSRPKFTGLKIMDQCGNDPSAGSPTETLLRLHLPLNDKV